MWIYKYNIYTHIYLYLYLYLSIYLSIYLSVYLSIYLSIYIHIIYNAFLSCISHSIDTCTVAIKNIRNMHAVSINQIADILHFNNNM